MNDLQGGIFANEDDIPEVLADENLLGNVVFELSIDMLYKEQLIRLLVRSSRGWCGLKGALSAHTPASAREVLLAVSP